MTAAEERAFVLQTFQDSMQEYKNKKIALYGLGVNSEYLVTHQQGYQIVALLDAKRVGECSWGLPIISCEEALESVDVIVIVAKDESVPIIYDRIAWMEEKGMIITDIAGRKIVDKPDENMEKNPYWQRNLKELLLEIDNHDVITFDVFDTLVMRSVLKPADIFEIVGKIRSERYPEQGAQFTQLRSEAEKIAGKRYAAYHYEQIYEVLQEISDITEAQAKELAQIEFETEKRFLSPRTDMAEALEYAWSTGKKVYLISDMYFSGEQIKELLKKCGIVHYDGIAVSSDVGCWKWPNGDLFKKTIEMYNLAGKSVLHIGDNEGADWECGKKAGFDVYPIWSSYHMLEMSSLKYLLVNVKTVEDSCMLGIYIKKLLNSPFALNKKCGVLCIKDEYEVGFAGYGALLTAFVHWLIKEHYGKSNEKILFLARDGYLLHHLYQQILSNRNIADVPRGYYVFASRRALAVPAIFSREDLEEQLQRIENQAECGAFLEMRFGVKPYADDKEAKMVMQGKELQNYLRKYSEEILTRAEWERQNYISYLVSCGIDFTKDKHVLIDSATTGTSAYYWRKFVQSNATMEAILLMDITNWSTYDAKFDRAFLKCDSKFLRKRSYNKSEILNDSILTSPDGQLMYIEESTPVFSEHEKQREWDKIKRAQDGIEDFCKEYTEKISYSVFLQENSIEFLDDFIRVLLEGCSITENVKNSFIVIEQFSGKMGKIGAWN